MANCTSDCRSRWGPRSSQADRAAMPGDLDWGGGLKMGSKPGLELTNADMAGHGILGRLCLHFGALRRAAASADASGAHAGQSSGLQGPAPGSSRHREADSAQACGSASESKGNVWGLLRMRSSAAETVPPNTRANAGQDLPCQRWAWSSDAELIAPHHRPGQHQGYRDGPSSVSRVQRLGIGPPTARHPGLVVEAVIGKIA